MPIYEYECSQCGHNLEVIQKISDALLTECPACHAVASLRKKVSAGAFHLKGSGWYATDFKDKPRDTSKPADDTKKSTETSAKDTEKPATGTDPKTTTTGPAPAPKKVEPATSD